MENFSRIMPKQGCEEWPEKLGRMSQLFYEAEYQTVKKRLRTAATLNIDPNNLQAKMEKINKDSLIFAPLRKLKHFPGYSLCQETAEPGEPFLWFGCLTRTYKDAQTFKQADLKQDYRTIGHMLGFPDCCIDYFKKTFPVNPDPVWVNLEGKIIGYPECNTLLRYFGVRMVSHMPCLPRCQATKKLGEDWLKVMQDIDKNLADEFYNLLATPVTWNSYHGVVQIETPYFIGLANTFPYLRKPRIIRWKPSRIKEKTPPQRKIKLKIERKKRK
ncbi:hypothetical protein COT20_01060 [bacterium (Candidatus Gribaldobacteria) CG08_land_8_20_14_0_20_39_15]|uniref:Uncharacterized protein n=1 Tax=bacterium (Candidatus Gribaldobacteria) CG08_land_8_20_14_0_20_39_15 TaxID=2014273 RepID=A0A2M6XUQ8_9BACT|nr:MAG: hypothetical protein COT20_01060 [bacterium (Candidatus Gribaldobacteria) CG08_land_8_20_14_0_20_39_15]